MPVNNLNASFRAVFNNYLCCNHQKWDSLV